MDYVIKIKDISKEKAKQICKAHPQCYDCPFNRTRKDKNGQIFTLYCYWILKKWFEGKLDLTEIEEQEIVLKE